VRSSWDASATKRRSLASDAGSKGALDLSEHRVQRQSEPADLGVRLGALDATGKVAGPDRRCRSLDGDERAQADPHDPQRERHEGGQDAERHEQLDQKQAVQRGVDVVKRGRDHEQLITVLDLDRSAYPIAAAAAGRRGREVANAVGLTLGRRVQFDGGRESWR
jgi:hypothetical protein